MGCVESVWKAKDTEREIDLLVAIMYDADRPFNVLSSLSVKECEGETETQNERGRGREREIRVGGSREKVRGYVIRIQVVVCRVR